jgi:hypothetical protein
VNILLEIEGEPYIAGDSCRAGGEERRGNEVTSKWSGDLFKEFWKGIVFVGNGILEFKFKFLGEWDGDDMVFLETTDNV